MLWSQQISNVKLKKHNSVTRKQRELNRDRGYDLPAVFNHLFHVIPKGSRGKKGNKKLCFSL